MSRVLLPCAALLAALALVAPASAVGTTAVISEFQTRGPGGGNDDFVELRNVSGGPLAIGGWALSGCNAGGAIGVRATAPAGTTLPAGGTYVFGNTNVATPRDTGYGSGITDTGGARLTDPTGAIVDEAGAAGTNPCKEGAGLPLPTTGATAAFERKANGTQDSDDNVADFDGPGAPEPEPCGAACTGPSEPAITPIHDVQGPGPSSPRTGQSVTVEAVVTGVDDEIGANFERTFPGDAGIFVQEEDADADADPATSEGIFVGFVRPRASYPPGTVVRLEGRVVEQFGETRVKLTLGSAPERLGTALVPAPVVVDPVAARAQDPVARAYYESLEGANVRIEVGTATSGGRNKFGETFLTLGVNQAPADRVFRAETVPELIAADADAGAGDPDNPLVDTDSTTELEADLFDVVRGLEGPLGFSFGNYKAINQPDRHPLVEQGPTPFPYTLAPKGSDQLRIASFNLENYFPPGTELDLRIVTQAEYDEKRARLVDAIGALLDRPDVLAVQEVYDRPSLQALADDLGGYRAHLEPGNDTRGIDVGFLIADGVVHADVRQLGKSATGPAGFDCSDLDGGLFDRPPLAVDIVRQGVAFTLFSNHFSSKAAPDECRAAQAAFVRDEVRRIEAAGGEAIVAGDLNAFEHESALTTLQDGSTSLDNLWDVPPASERYSFQFDGRLQTLDHMLLTDGLRPRLAAFRYAHFDNDYHERRGAATDGHHASDHDPPLLTLNLVAPPVQRRPPSISGVAKKNHWVVGFPGAWRVGEGGLARRYRWLRCSTTEPDSCAAIPGETRRYHRVRKADRRTYLRFEVTATGVGGTTVGISAPVRVR